MRSPRRLLLVAVVAVSCALFSACHEQRGQGEGGPARRLPPVEEGNPSGTMTARDLSSLPVWKTELLPRTDWQLGVYRMFGDWRITYRVPINWSIDARGRTAQSGNELVKLQVSVTPLRESEIRLATYATSLAGEGSTWRHVTASGQFVLVSEREVSVAPSDPAIGSTRFHSVLFSVDGRIVKIDVVYDNADTWRYQQLARTIITTADAQILADE